MWGAGRGGGGLTWYTHLACQLAVVAHKLRSCSAEEFEIFTTFLLDVKARLLICREKNN